MLDNNLHNTRGEVVGTAQLFGCIGATSRTIARATGYTDFGNFKGMELTGEAATSDRVRAVRGKLTRAGFIPGKMGSGYKFATQEVADARKFRFALLGDQAGDFTQPARAAVAADALVFTVGAPAVVGRWYPILVGGARVYELTACTVAAKVEGVDFVVDYKLGAIRFLAAQTANITPSVSAPAIDAASQFAMQVVTPITRSFWTGYWSVSIWDQDLSQNLVLRHEEFLGDLKVTSWPKIDGENAGELEFEISVNAGDPGVVHHRV